MKKISEKILILLLCIVVVMIQLPHFESIGLTAADMEEQFLELIENEEDPEMDMTITLGDGNLIINISGEEYATVNYLFAEDVATFNTNLKFTSEMDEDAYSEEALKAMMLLTMFSYVSVINGGDADKASEYIYEETGIMDLFEYSDTDNFAAEAKSIISEAGNTTDDLFTYKYENVTSTNSTYSAKAVLKVYYNEDFSKIGGSASSGNTTNNTTTNTNTNRNATTYSNNVTSNRTNYSTTTNTTNRNSNNTNIPSTGIEDVSLIIFAVIAIGIISYVSYNKYNGV